MSGVWPAPPSKDEVMMNKEEIISYLNNKNKAAYSRLNYDAFLKEIGFKFNKEAIHITGTNGKGSVAYFLSAIYQASGYKVGRFISPSLNSPLEMITINDKEISPKEFFLIMNEHQAAIEAHQLTEFEIVTFVALTYFTREKVDLAIIEVGMGGKVDATNIFKPSLSIITNVSVEHTSYLGKTIKEIAAHKAGIIKTKIPVLVGNMPLEAFTVIAETAMKKDAPIYGVKNPLNIRVSLDGICFDALDYKDVCLSIPASYEANNAALVLNAVEILARKFPVERSILFKAMKEVIIPARFSIVRHKPLVIVDGGHNPHAISALINAVKMLNHNQLHVVFASFKDKDVEKEFDLFALTNASVTLTTFEHSRARKKLDYQSYYPFIESYQEAINETIEAAKEDEVVLITGSLHFALKVYEEMRG